MLAPPKITMKFIMPVTPISEDTQIKAVNAYNANVKKYQDKIPLMQRNIHTGWPLLQVSLYTPTEDAHPVKYQHALGGGKCHYFYIGAFNLAHLLTKIPGTITVTKSLKQKQATKEEVRADRVDEFLEGFKIHHKGIAMTISSTAGQYGKMLKVTIPIGADKEETRKLSKLLQGALEHPLAYAAKPKSKFRTIGGWHDAPAQTETEIQAQIKNEVATFANGQIFIDFGSFLNEKVADEQIIEYFTAIFKVDEFLELQKSTPELQAKEPAIVVQEQNVSHHKANSFFEFPNATPNLPSRTGETIEQALPQVQYTNLPDLYSNIKLMKKYGEDLIKEDREKGIAVINFANELNETAGKYFESVLPVQENFEQFKQRFITAKMLYCRHTVHYGNQ